VSKMTPEQESKCHKIIHTAAAGAGAGNLIPVPGTGVAADIVAMSMMAMSLASVFGGNLTEEVAKGMAVTALKQTMLKQPIKVLTKELSKLIRECQEFCVQGGFRDSCPAAAGQESPGFIAPSPE